MSIKNEKIIWMFPFNAFHLAAAINIESGNRSCRSRCGSAATARYLKGIVEKPDYQGMLDCLFKALAGAGQEVGYD